MMKTYPAKMDDLRLFADAASELDAYKDCLPYKSAEQAKILAMICRIHEAVTYLAGEDAVVIYGEIPPDD